MIENKEVEAKIYNLKAWILDADLSICEELLKMLQATQFGVLKYEEHNFPNGGWTSVWLLAESHLAAHSFKKEKKTYLELSGCNKSKTKAFKELLTQQFQLDYIEYSEL